MTITDEMVEAALREWSRPNDARPPSGIMRAALEAADAAAWQAMDSAPPNDEVIVYLPDDARLGIFACVTTDGTGDHGIPNFHTDAIRWRPLPAAPKGGGA